MNIKQLITGVFLLLPPALFSQTLPVEKNVRTGKLANGLTYYIRHNETPARRAYLYLVNNVGSVLEDDDQQGLAHFMEHMNFNGTKHYPKNELEDFLQKAGVRFGADLNAHTGYDETVFQLPIPTDEPGLLEKGVGIIRDWAQDALLDSTDIEEERGVVLEEERLRLGADERMRRQYMPMLLNHSRYTERTPIGLHSILTTFSPGTIRRFHHDWYRPDLQAVIIVGDVNVDSMEMTIKQKFSDLKNPQPERKRIAYNIPITSKNYFLQVTDKEYAQDNIEIFVKHQALRVKTEADYRRYLIQNVFSRMLAARRYAEISRQRSSAYSNMAMDIEPLLDGADMFAFNVVVKNADWKNAFVQAWSYIGKLLKYGFTQAELDKAKGICLQSLEQRLKTLTQTPSEDFIKEYQDAFLNGNAIPGPEWEAQYAKAYIAEITLQDVNGILHDYIKGYGRDIFVMAPETHKLQLPDSSVISSWMLEVSDSALAPFTPDSIRKPLFAQKVKRGKVVRRKSLPELGVTEVTMSNGVKLVLKPTAFKTDQIFFRGFAPGGTSLYNDSDYDAAVNAAGLVSHCGWGNLNLAELSNILTGKTLDVKSIINPRNEEINGGASPADLETALQLLHLHFTSPRKDSLLFKNTIENAAATIADKYANPMNVFADTMNYVLGDYTYRSLPQTPQRLRNISLEKVYKIYKERFADASGFTFVFVGDFKIDSLLPLAEQYLGSLPSSYSHTKARDLGTHIPLGQLEKKVYGNVEDKAVVRLVFSGGYPYSAINNLNLNALTQILEMLLLRDIREKEGEVYTPSVQMLNNKYPQKRYAVIVTFGCAPANAEHLISEVKQEMQALVKNGPLPEDVQKFKAAYEKTLETSLMNNAFWLQYLVSQYKNHDDVLQVNKIKALLQSMTQISLKKAAGLFMNGKNCIRFELLPGENRAAAGW